MPPRTEVTAEVSFWLWSEQQSDFNTWPVVGFVGTNDPEREVDFKVIGQTDQGAGWTRYSHREVIRSGPSGEVWVAFGFGATWETSRTHYLDLAKVKLRARSVRAR